MLRREQGSLVVDQPTTISSKEGTDGFQFCTRHQIRSIADLRTVGVIPRFIDLDVVQREFDKVTKPKVYTTESKRRLNVELKKTRPRRQAAPHRTDAFNQARLNRIELDLQAELLTAALGAKVPLSIRRNISRKSIELARAGSYTLIEFRLDGDLDVRAPLILDESIGMATVQNLRIAPTGSFETQSQYFILRARSASGSYRSAQGPAGTGGTDGAQGTPAKPGVAGRAAVCRDILHGDQVPTNGGRGGNGGAGTDGGDGGDGGDGNVFEAHLEILLSNLIVDTGGGKGGEGGKGGKGGNGGQGGRGGDGKGCEPSGVGGAGGDGGKGGNAGNGGNAGDAGDIYVYYVSDQSASNPPVLTAMGGQGGAAGEIGLGGDPGSPGAPGPESKYGNARWDPGAPKGPGAVGANGTKGTTGKPGKNGVTVLQKVEMV